MKGYRRRRRRPAGSLGVSTAKQTPVLKDLETEIQEADRQIICLGERILFVHKQSDVSGSELRINVSKFGGEKEGVKEGDILELTDVLNGSRILLTIKQLEECAGKWELSMVDFVATQFGFTPSTHVMVRKIDPKLEQAKVKWCCLSFKRMYLSRSDMWRYSRGLYGRCVYLNELVKESGTEARVVMMKSGGAKVSSGVVGEDTMFVFRSESSNLHFMVQVSLEMSLFADDGYTYFEKMLRFFKTLFEKWRKNNINHCYSITFFCRCMLDPQTKKIFDENFTRVEQTEAKGQNAGFFSATADGQLYQDFYVPVFRKEYNYNWSIISQELRKQYYNLNRMTQNVFARLRLGNNKFANKLKSKFSSSAEGNLLEAIGLICNAYDKHYINRHLHQTGISICVVTAGNGFFFTDKKMTKFVSNQILDNGIGCDIVSLSHQPLHDSPLFLYRGRTGLPEIKNMSKWKQYQFEHPVNWLQIKYFEVDRREPKREFEPLPSSQVIDYALDGILPKAGACKTKNRLRMTNHERAKQMFELYDENVFCSNSNEPAMSPTSDSLLAEKEINKKVVVDDHISDPSSDPEMHEEDEIHENCNKEMTLRGNSQHVGVHEAIIYKEQIDDTAIQKEDEILDEADHEFDVGPIHNDVIKNEESDNKARLRFLQMNSAEEGCKAFFICVEETGASFVEENDSKWRMFNRFNPMRKVILDKIKLERWGHICPVAEQFSCILKSTDEKTWTALLNPAILPLTTSSKSSVGQGKKSWSVTNENGKGRDLFFELIAQRLAMDFQIEVGTEQKNEFKCKLRNLTTTHFIEYNKDLDQITVTRTSDKRKETKETDRSSANKIGSFLKFQTNFYVWNDHKQRFVRNRINLNESHEFFNFNQFDQSISHGDGEQFHSKTQKVRHQRYVILPPENVYTCSDTDRQKLKLEFMDRFLKFFHFLVDGNGKGLQTAIGKRSDGLKIEEPGSRKGIFFGRDKMNESKRDSGFGSHDPALETRDVKIYLPDQFKGRRSSINIYYDKVFDGEACWHFEVHWLVASGFQVSRFIQSLRNEARKHGIQFHQIPAYQHSDSLPLLSVVSTVQSQQNQLFSHAVMYQAQDDLLRKHDFVLDTRTTSPFKQYLHRTLCCLVRVIDGRNLEGTEEIPRANAFCWIPNVLLGKEMRRQSAKLWRRFDSKLNRLRDNKNLERQSKHLLDVSFGESSSDFYADKSLQS